MTPSPARWKPGSSRAATGLLLDYAEEVGIPKERTGALLVAWTAEQLDRFPAVEDNARRNAHHRTRAGRRRRALPSASRTGPGALVALEVPDEYIICPWMLPLACAAQAVLAGAELRRFTRVTDLRRLNGGSLAGSTRQGALTGTLGGSTPPCCTRTRSIRMAGHEGFTVTPLRGAS